MRYSLPIRWAIVLAAVPGLAACTTMALAPGTPPSQGFDFFGDDLAGAVIAVDLPPGALLVPAKSVLHYDAAASGVARRVAASVVPADGDTVDESLPPPAKGHTYYLVSVAPADQPALRAAEAWANGLHEQGQTPDLKVAFDPTFCANGPIDAARTPFGLRIALPGYPRFAPLAPDQPLLSTLPAGQTALPACG